MSPKESKLFTSNSFSIKFSYPKKFSTICRYVAISSKIMFKYSTSTPSLLMFLLLGEKIAEQIVGHYIGLLTSIFYEIIPQNSISKFFSTIAFCIFLIMLMSIILAAIQFTKKVLEAVVRKNLSKYLQNFYLKPTIFYNINKICGDFHHDQVITQDVDK